MQRIHAFQELLLHAALFHILSKCDIEFLQNIYLHVHLSICIRDLLRMKKITQNISVDLPFLPYLQLDVYHNHFQIISLLLIEWLSENSNAVSQVINSVCFYFFICARYITSFKVSSLNFTFCIWYIILIVATVVIHMKNNYCVKNTQVNNHSSQILWIDSNYAVTSPSLRMTTQMCFLAPTSGYDNEIMIIIYIYLGSLDMIAVTYGVEYLIVWRFWTKQNHQVSWQASDIQAPHTYRLVLICLF